MVPERLDFGIFLAPFHPAGENPTLALRRDIELITWLDELGYDEVWAGEHHSGGWEISASPEMFLAVAGEHTSRIRLGTRPRILLRIGGDFHSSPNPTGCRARGEILRCAQNDGTADVTLSGAKGLSSEEILRWRSE